MNDFKQPVSVLVVIHTPGLEVLLLERAAHPGYWQSVTGSRETGETLLETARREVSEETGLKLPSAKFLDWQQQNHYEIYAEWRHRYAPGVTHNTEHVFSLEIPDCRPPQLAPAEHRAWRWLPWTEAAKQCFSPSNREAILQLPTRLATPT